jgi:predicted DNA-binding antitoxin AbrB/MazE fold protein
MPKTFGAVYEQGVLRPLEPLALAERQRVSLTMEEASAELKDDDVLDQELLNSLDEEIRGSNGSGEDSWTDGRRLQRRKRGALLIAGVFLHSSAIAKLYHVEVGTSALRSLATGTDCVLYISRLAVVGRRGWRVLIRRDIARLEKAKTLSRPVRDCVAGANSKAGTSSTRANWEL